MKHSVYDRRNKTTSTQVVRYDKRARSFVDEVSGIAYKTLNHMGDGVGARDGVEKKTWVSIRVSTDAPSVRPGAPSV